MVKIDIKDRKIIAALDMDARMPITLLAKKAGLSRQATEYRIKRLKNDGIILSSVGVFDSVVAGYQWYRVVFRLLQVTKKQKDTFLTSLANHDCVLWLGEVGGNWDVIVNLTCADNLKFNELFEQIVEEYGSYIMDYEILIYVDVHDQSRAYILQDTLSVSQQRQEFYHRMKENLLLKLDDLDKHIIKELSHDALISNLKLGQKYNVTANTIKHRIDQMKENGLLLGFRLFINVGLLGYESHVLFLEITKLNLKREKELYAYLHTIPHITFLVKHIGKWRIGLEIETKTVEQFQNIFVDIRARFSDIISDYQSSPIFKDHIINYFPSGCLKQH